MTEKSIKQFYEKAASVYDQTRFTSFQGEYVDCLQKSAVLELIGNCAGKNILEIGSGTGRFTRELVKKGANVFCVDLSKSMHLLSSQKINATTNSVNYFVMSGLDLGFADESFDYCLTVNMMSHIENYSAVLAEVSRVLKKQGFFIANFPNMAGIYFSIGMFVNLFKCSLQAPVYSRWYSLRAVNKSLKSAGFFPVRLLWLMIFPKKRCPLVLFKSLIALSNVLERLNLHFLLGDLMIKSCRY